MVVFSIVVSPSVVDHQHANITILGIPNVYQVRHRQEQVSITRALIFCEEIDWNDYVNVRSDI